MGDQLPELEAAGGGQCEDSLRHADLVPTVLQVWCDPGDLRADDGDAVVVELLPEAQCRGPTLEEAAGDHAAAVPRGADGFMQGLVAARHLDDHVSPAAIAG